MDGPSPWVSPVVIAPKPGSNNIRLCVDMRQANTAILRERYPIPTVDEILEQLNGSTVFTKMDLKWGFHQILLEETSREITTFAVDDGLYRYKRLMFGISCAPELYQHIIRQVLSECKGVLNIADDVIVHGKDYAEHDDNGESPSAPSGNRPYGLPGEMPISAALSEVLRSSTVQRWSTADKGQDQSCP